MGIEELKPEELLLNELMQEYSGTVYQLEETCQKLNTQIDELTKMRDYIGQPYINALKDIEAKMHLPMLERKATFVCAFGKINFRKGATTRKWNLDALDQICAAKPEIKENIWAFREEKVGEPSITVKLVVEK